ncbi:MAG: TM2 domain-containing protein [Mucinivorans sp.]
MFCKHCGAEIDNNAVICVKCGCPVGIAASDPTLSSKNGLVVLLLCIFTGSFGIHSFYAGRTGVGVGQLLTLGGCGIWTLVDFIMILTGSYKDGEGKIVKL